MLMRSQTEQIRSAGLRSLQNHATPIYCLLLLYIPQPLCHTSFKNPRSPRKPFGSSGFENGFCSGRAPAQESERQAGARPSLLERLQGRVRTIDDCVTAGTGTRRSATTRDHTNAEAVLIMNMVTVILIF